MITKRPIPDFRAGIMAGLLGGVLFLILEMIMVPVFGGGSPWGPPRMMAAIVMGKEVLPPPATFSLGVVLVALIVHLILSAVYGVLFAAAVSRLGLGGAAGVGIAGGLLLYIINFYGFTVIFPWFENARNWITIFSHIVFGLSVALIYKPAERPYEAAHGVPAEAH